jgi:creatinine amidohydrolase
MLLEPSEHRGAAHHPLPSPADDKLVHESRIRQLPVPVVARTFPSLPGPRVPNGVEGLRHEFLSVTDIRDSPGPSAHRADSLVPERRDEKAASCITRAGTGITPVHPSRTVHGHMRNDTDLRTPRVLYTDHRARGAKCAILPLGSFEQHGDYLPLITDTVVATVIAQELANTYSLLRLPPVTISCSHEHSAWAGTVSISATTLYSLIGDIYSSVTNSGLTSLVILNGHGGNYVLGNVVQEGSAQGKRMALFPSTADWAEARQSGRLVSSGHEDMHAGEIETSILLHAHPELVRDGYEAADWVADDRRHLLTTGMGEYTRSGVIGRPSLGSAEKGKAVLASLVDSFAAVLEILQGDG